jgi:hypothetical protein
MSHANNQLTKTDTVALWHALQWMESVLHEWRREGFRDEKDRAQYDGQRENLLQARRALRKVNQLRNAQATLSRRKGCTDG